VSDAGLFELIEAIRARDSARALSLLAAQPALARAAFTVNGNFPRPIGAYFYKGDTALHFAANAYDTEVARALIAAGADVRARNRRGHEPLHLAASGQPDQPGWNPTAQTATIRLLIAAGADANATYSGGVTPLHRAVRCRCAEAVKALLAHGANPKARNEAGSSAWKLAHHTTGRGGSGSPEAKAEQAEILAILAPFADAA